MKLFCSILFSLLVFFAGTKNLFFLVDYQVNMDYYEAVCENQNRPEMECHGKCQVSKKAGKNSDSLSFNHFSFDFYPLTTTEISVPQGKSVPGIAAKTPHTVTTLNAVFRGVPHPPPNI